VTGSRIPRKRECPERALMRRMGNRKELCSMFIKHRRYEATEHFIGLIWRGYAVVGIDLAPWAWGVVAGKFWAGWYWE